MAEWRRMAELAQRTKCSANKKRNKIENNSQSEAKDDPHRRYMPALKTNEMFPNSKRCNRTASVAALPAAAGLRLPCCHTRSTPSPTDQGSRQQATGACREPEILQCCPSRPKDEQSTRPRRR